MQFLGNDVNPLGLGCWPSAGPMYAPDGKNLGYSNASDASTIEAFNAAKSNGITIFDTAAAYGAGHSERLLGKTIGNSTNCQIVTKIGIGINEHSKVLSFDSFSADQVSDAIDQSLSRLRRDTIDVLLLHINSLSIQEATPLFTAMQKAREQGKVKGFGWSTDFANSLGAVTTKRGFVAVEHAMNVLLDAPRIQRIAHNAELITLIRSPLAMGLLSGKYDNSTRMTPEDIRASDEGWLQYFVEARPNPVFLDRFHAIRELLQSDGRSIVQGALGWIWGKHNQNIPIPGARTVRQVEQLAGALEFGALPEGAMEEIESLIDRTHRVDDEDRER